MKVFVSGGTGFLGGSVARRLRLLGHEVAIQGRNAAAAVELERLGIEFFPAQITDSAGLARGLAGAEAVVHCAAHVSPHGPCAEFYESNVLGTRALLKEALKAGVRRFVNISTPSVYFENSHRVGIRESDPLPSKPFTHYAATKLLADAEVAQSGLEVVTLRPRAIVGAGDVSILPRLLRLRRDSVFTLLDKGEALIDLTHIENVVDAVVLGLQVEKEQCGSTYNITNGEPMSVRAVVEKLCSALNLPVRFRSIPSPVAYPVAAAVEAFYSALCPGKEPPLTRYGVGLMARSQVLDISKARDELGYRPRLSLDDAFAAFASRNRRL